MWQTEHTAGEIQEAGSRGGNYPKNWMLAVANVRGALVSEHFWIDGYRLRDVTKASQRGKRRAAPERGSSIAQSVVNRGWDGS